MINGGSNIDTATVKHLVYAVRAKCLECMNRSPKEITRCEIKHCGLYQYREAKVRQEFDFIRDDMLKAIKNKCINCCSFSKKFVDCDIKTCPLHRFIPLIDER